MKPPILRYVRPTTLDEALDELAREDGVVPTLGGQSLVILLRLRLAAPEVVADVSRIAELTNISEGDHGALRIGAATTHAAIEDCSLPDVTNGLMPYVASGIAYRAVRNLGTIGGSLALADPSADWPLCLLALGAKVEISGKGGIRTVEMDDYLISAFTTAVESHELLTGVHIPPLPEGSRWGYVKLARKHGAFADSLCATIFSPNARPRVALGATTDRAVLLHNTMELLADAPTIAGEVLKGIVAEDVRTADPEADSFRHACHVTTVLRSIRQARECLP